MVPFLNIGVTFACFQSPGTSPVLASSSLESPSVFQVPNSAPGRGNIEIEIYGMEGIPEADVKAHESRHGGGGDDEDDSGGGGVGGRAGRAKSDSPGLATPPIQPAGQC